MKKEYEKPQIIELGSLTDMTKAGGSWIGEDIVVYDFSTAQTPNIYGEVS